MLSQNLHIALTKAYNLAEISSAIPVITAWLCLLPLLWIILRRLKQSEANSKQQQQQLRTETRLRQLAEEKLLQMERMDSLGLLASGVAHDFNNLLVGVIGNAEILKHCSGGVLESVSECTDQILVSANKAAELSQQLLTYSRQRPTVLTEHDLNDRIKQLETLLNSEIAATAKIKLRLSNTQLLAQFDGTQLDQIVMNLVSNAQQACGDDGEIVIKTGFEFLTSDEAYSNPNLYGIRPGGGNFCFVEVADNGAGIPKKQLSSVFDPFTSTSKIGHGLGLAVVYGLVASNNGLISLKSSARSGTRIRILLPQATESQLSSPMTEPASELWQANSASLLLIGDDPDTNERVSDIAAAQNMVVKPVSLGGDGLLEIRNQLNKAGPDDFLLIDLSITLEKAENVLATLEHWEIEMPTIIISGRNQAMVNRLRCYSNVVRIIEQPFRGSDLLASLQLKQHSV